jgi:ribulose-phosphate 3-epimerase
VGTELLNERRVAPSILSADFSRLGGHVKEVMDAGAKVIHVDVMDGHFVPPITIGPLVAGSISDQVHDEGGWLDVHLMIERPERHVSEFAKAGADSITVHFEATPHVHYALKAVREAGCLAGLALNPGTLVEAVESVTDLADLVLCMTVNPGWGGQSFIGASIERLQRLRPMVPASTYIEVDGGIDTETAPECAAAGAGLFVAGSSVFAQPDPAEAYRALAASIDAA